MPVIRSISGSCMKAPVRTIVSMSSFSLLQVTYWMAIVAVSSGQRDAGKKKNESYAITYRY